jgi:molybdate transport system substrate-binding protein
MWLSDRLSDGRVPQPHHPEMEQRLRRCMAAVMAPSGGSRRRSQVCAIEGKPNGRRVRPAAKTISCRLARSYHDDFNPASLYGALMIKTAIASLALFLTSVATSNAAEVTLFSGAALRRTFAEVLPQFERDTGHKVIVVYGSVGALTDRLEKGEIADVAIVSDTQIAELEKLGKVVAGSSLDVARVGVGAFVRKDSPKPDISSIDAFKRTVLAAKAVAYSDPAGGGPAGIYVARLMERLGISAEMNQRTKLYPPGPLQYESVANGEADLGFEQISLILEQPIVELLGPLPAPIQYYTKFAAGIGARSNQTEAAKAFIAFLSSPPVQTRMQANGFESGKN